MHTLPKCWAVGFRKEELRKGLFSSPTYLQSEADLGVDDY